MAEEAQANKYVNKRLLIINEGFLQEFGLIEQLGLGGWEVDSVDDEEKAIDKLGRNAYDALLISLSAYKRAAAEMLSELAKAELRNGEKTHVIGLLDETKIGDIKLVFSNKIEGLLRSPFKPTDVSNYLEKFFKEAAFDSSGSRYADIHRGKEIAQPLVLVVDDDPTARMIAEDMLEDKGFKVDLAIDGVDALEIMAKRAPNLILMDVEMPRLDGFSACQELRKLAGFQDVPVIMVTGRDDPYSAELAFEVEATDFVSKPINWPVLMQRIRQNLRVSSTISILKRAEHRLANAQRVAKLGYWDWDLENDFLSVSPELKAAVGHPDNNTHDMSFFFSIVKEDVREAVERELSDKMRSGGVFTSEFQVIGLDGREITLWLEGESEIGKSGNVIWSMGVVQDITERRRDEENIHYLAYHDKLTGLPNREAFQDQLSSALLLHKKMHSSLAVLHLDVDGFKRVNDSLGNQAGDLILQEFANRVGERCHCSNGSGELNLARLGGDEYSFFIPGVKNKNDVLQIVDRIIEGLKQPFKIELDGTKLADTEFEIVVSSSIGIAIYPEDGESTFELQKNAAAAVTASKTKGGGHYSFYSNSMSSGLTKGRLTMEMELRKALERGELSLSYQPQIDLSENRMVGVEALLRWQNELLGPVSPVDFIPLAEETGLIIPIGNWVLETACQQLKEWQNEGLPEFTVAVNLSALQFNQQNLSEKVKSILQHTGLASKHLELELTEGLLIENVDSTMVILEDLKKMGVKISIDDFGTGYSSLSYLKQFPIDVLKIDRSFVNDLGSDEGSDDTSIVSAIVALGQGLGLEVIAEGVENQQQLNFLKERKCDLIQGYLFSRPVPAAEFSGYFLKEKDRWKALVDEACVVSLS